MYPKNAASPERLAIGAVVQISDGAVQTSGVSVKVKPQGASASAGGGTIGYEEGVVDYIPTQAETNYSSFVLIAYKTGCLPASVTVVTTASPTAGYAGVDWSKITAPTTTVSLSGTTVGTITTYTGNTPQTGDSYARIGATGSGLTSLATQASVDAIDNFVDSEIADIQSRLPAALVGGRMDASLGAAAANTITASALASDAVTEIQSGLATASAVSALQTNVDDLPTNAELATALAAADDAVLAAIAGLNDVSVTDILTTAMTEAYPTDGSTMTVAQALYLIAQTIGEFSISGTTITVKKLDGSTTAATYTLDSSTTPTSRTRAS